MKKKVLLGVLAIFLIVALVSCDEASWDKIGELMGDMGNNVYGIKPNMEDVAAVTSTIDNSVKTEKDEESDEYKIVIDLDSASEIIQKLSEIGTSTQKLSQAKEDLKTELKVAGKEPTEIQTALQDSLDKVISNTLPNAEDIENEQVKKVVEDVKTALTTIKDKIPEAPTQADLATVVIINSLATQVAELKKEEEHNADALIPLVDKALAALDALKVTTEVSDIDVLGEFNITSLLSSTKKEETKEMSNEDYMKYVSQLEQSIVKLVSQFAEKDSNGVYKFNKVKYQRFLLQMSAIRASYEIASYALMPSIGSDFLSGDNLTGLMGDKKVNIFESERDNINKLKNKKDFDTNDLVLYLLSVVATEMDKRATNFLATDSAEALFKEFLSDNENNLKKIPIEDLDCSAFVDAYNNKETLDIALDDTASDICALARTAFVVSLESGIDNFILMFAGEDVTIDAFLSEQLQNLVHTINGK